MFISKFSKPSLITYLGIVIGVVGLYCAAGHLPWAAVCLFLCAVCDFFDGRFARSFDRNEHEKKFGIAIDSLADTLLFLALPGVILFSFSGSVVAVLIACVYALCAITRLAVFTSEAEPDKKTAYYRGLPVTYAGFIIPLVYGAVALLPFAVAEAVLYIVYLALALLFVLNISVKKP